MTRNTLRTLEGRQVRTLQDMMDFCEAALAAARVDDRTIQPDDIDMDTPHDMRLHSEMLGSDKTKLFSIAVTSW